MFLRRLIEGAIATGVSMLLIANAIILFGRTPAYTATEVPTSTVALVFGGGMFDEHTMSDLQTDRVETAVALYQARKVERLIMTGDDGARRVNEVDAMKTFAIAHGVPTTSIYIDPHGYNTYASCERAKSVFALEHAIVVSQAFHLPRIQYLCKHFDVKTIPVKADAGPYGFWGSLWGMHLREYLARLKVVFMIQKNQL